MWEGKPQQPKKCRSAARKQLVDNYVTSSRYAHVFNNSLRTQANKKSNIRLDDFGTIGVRMPPTLTDDDGSCIVNGAVVMLESDVAVPLLLSPLVTVPVIEAEDQFYSEDTWYDGICYLFYMMYDGTNKNLCLYTQNHCVRDECTNCKPPCNNLMLI